jgi:hypothetical protein
VTDLSLSSLQVDMHMSAAGSGGVRERPAGLGIWKKCHDEFSMVFPEYEVD